MTTLRDEFEALMPEPAYKITGKMGEFICIRAKSYDNKKGDGLYTADQLRKAMSDVYQAATERAAKACEDEASSASFVGNLGAQLAAERIAAAIRGERRMG